MKLKNCRLWTWPVGRNGLEAKDWLILCWWRRFNPSQEPSYFWIHGNSYQTISRDNSFWEYLSPHSSSQGDSTSKKSSPTTCLRKFILRQFIFKQSIFSSVWSLSPKRAKEDLTFWYQKIGRYSRYSRSREWQLLFIWRWVVRDERSNMDIFGSGD
jgi:hypothetical protein